MDITKLNEVELKALVYDQAKELNRIQQNINLIEAEIEKKKQVKPEVPEVLETPETPEVPKTL